MNIYPARAMVMKGKTCSASASKGIANSRKLNVLGLSQFELFIDAVIDGKCMRAEFELSFIKSRHWITRKKQIQKIVWYCLEGLK
jgi:hypothetical protein